MIRPIPIPPATLAIAKAALAALARIEPDGLARESLLDLAQLAGQRLLTTAERQQAFFVLRDREWIAPHTNPITGWETWSITANGLSALAAL